MRYRAMIPTAQRCAQKNSGTEHPQARAYQGAAAQRDVSGRAFFCYLEVEMMTLIEQQRAGKIVQMNVRLPADLKQAVKVYSVQHSTTVCAWIEKALREQLARTATATGVTK